MLKLPSTYDPEKIIRLLPEIRDAYRNTIEMEIYAVIAQGINEYYDDKLLHISGNHVSLNSPRLTICPNYGNR